MLTISTTDAQNLYTKMLVDVYKEKPKPTNFLRSFFPTQTAATLEVSIEVQRGTEQAAVDVVRGTDGNRNQFSRSSEKIFVPPYFREWFDATQLQLYDRLYGATEITDAVFAQYVNDVADHAITLQNKIERAYELQIAQIFETGIVIVNAGTNIDFKRKAASKVTATAKWATAGTDVFAQFEAGCKFLRTVGKAGGAVFNAILGSQALTDLLANDVFLKRQNLFNMALDVVNSPQMAATGATYHGTITAGSYKVNLWAYPQYYDLSGTSTPYINDKKVVMFPENPNFKLAFAAVPQLIGPNTMPKVGAFHINEYIDQRGKARIVDIESAGLAIPTAVDTIYTMTVVA